MANNKAFKVKNGLQAGKYLQTKKTGTLNAVNWSIAGASYDSVSFSVSVQDTSPYGTFFKPDGTKMYVLGRSNNTVYQYTLGTAWDLSTASYDSVSFSVATEDDNSFNLFFKPDGTKMYTVGSTNDSVYQYTLGTAWDLSTASYDSVSFSVATEHSVPSDLFFKSDGTKMYVIGYISDAIYQYSLNTAWDLSTASYDSVSFSVASQDGNMYSLFFKPDGTKMYTAGSDNALVHQYDLSTAWDLSTASYDSVSFSVADQATFPANIFFKSDGTKMYVTDALYDIIYQYSTTGFEVNLDLSEATYFEVTISGGTEISFSNPPASGLACAFTIDINGNGSTIAWPTSVKWNGGTAPIASPTKELYAFITIGDSATYYGRKSVENLQ